MQKIMMVMLLLLTGVSAFALDFKTDKAHSKYGFTVTHLSISEVDGKFKDHKAFWTLDEKGVLQSFEAEVQTKSVDTDNVKRDKHLRNADFFEVEKYPVMTFKMQKHIGTKLVGELMIRGVKKQVVFDVKVSKVIQNPFSKDPQAKKVGVKLTTVINRKDFNVGSNYKNLTLSDEVEITVKLEGDSYIKK